MRFLGVGCASLALSFGQDAVWVDLALEARQEGRPRVDSGFLRIVCRVQAVCTHTSVHDWILSRAEGHSRLPSARSDGPRDEGCGERGELAGYRLRAKDDDFARALIALDAGRVLDDAIANVAVIEAQRLAAQQTFAGVIADGPHAIGVAWQIPG